MAVGDNVKKTVKNIVKVNRKTFFNPRRWFQYDTLKGQVLYLYDFGKQVFTAATPEREETFEEAMERLNLTESDIQTTANNYFLYSIVFLVIAVIAFIISFYFLIVHSSISAWILGLAGTALLVVQAFRFHFWYFQIKHRKLGCTFEEWKRGKPYENGESKA